MRYWRFSGFYLFYYAALGALVPYWSLYLHGEGYSAAQIGLLMALPLVSRVVAPNVWGWLADRQRDPMSVVRLAAVSAALVFCGVFIAHSLLALAMVMVGFTFFWHASLPQLEAATLTVLGTDYGRVRLWGSVGFIVVVLGLGALLDHVTLDWIPRTLAILLAGIAVFSFLVKRPVIGEPAPLRLAFLRRVWRPRVILFLLACFLMQASHGPYYTFFSIDLVQHGYSKTAIGALWAFAVLCEIAVFVWGRHLYDRVDLRTLFLCSFAAAVVRWTALSLFIDDPWVVVLAQTLHAATFGLYHGSAIQMAYRHFRGPYRNRGQALYGSAAGAGGAVGSLFSGALWHHLGGEGSFLVAAGLDVVAVAIVAFGVAPMRPRPRLRAS